jgi:ankyrin repeat protein
MDVLFNLFLDGDFETAFNHIDNCEIPRDCMDWFIMEAAKRDNIPILLKLLCLPHSQREIDTAISIAAGAGSLRAVKCLLEVGGSPCANHNAALRYACAHRKIDMVKFLLSNPKVKPCDNDNEVWRRAQDDGACGEELRKILVLDSRVNTKDTRHYYTWMSHD